MMLVPSYVAKSPIHGVGLFAAEPIAAGTRVCVFDLRHDLRFRAQEVARMPEPLRAFLRVYGFEDQEEPGFVCCEIDNGRFMNHADEPNVRQCGGSAHAARDIAAGEELTYDYRLLGLAPPGQPRLVRQTWRS